MTRPSSVTANSIAINTAADPTGGPAGTAGGVVDLGGATRTFTVADGAAPVDLTVSATIGSNGGVGSNAGGIVKAGPGTLELTAANNYAGNTQVIAGRLVVNNASNGSATGPGSVTVSGTGTLGGTGTIANTATDSPVTIADGGTISPGNSVGTLRTGAQSWNDGGTYAWEIIDDTTGAGVGWDLLDLGDAALVVKDADAKPFTILISRVGGLAGETVDLDGPFVIARYKAGQPATLDGIELTDATGDVDWAISQEDLGGGAYAVQVSPVPEPAALSVLALGSLVLLRRRTRLTPANI